MTITINIIVILFMSALLVTVSTIDRLLYKTYLTPGILLFVPYVIVNSLTIVFAPILKFNSVSLESVIIGTIGLLLFVLGSIFVWLIATSKYNFDVTITTEYYKAVSERLVISLSWIFIIVGCYGFWRALSTVGGILYIASDEFQEIYGYGWISHARSISMPLLIYLIGTVRRRDHLKQFTVFVFLFLIFVYQVKGWALLPIISGILYRIITGRLKLNVLKLVGILLTCSFIFLLEYSIGNFARNSETLIDNEYLLFYLNHLIFYLFAGVLGFSESIKHIVNYSSEDNMYILVSPFVNIYNVILSNSTLSYVTEYYKDVGNDYASNVHTFIGTIYLFAGKLYGACYIIVFSSISYLIFILSITTRNSWVLIAYTFFVSGLVLGWFEFYYWSIAFIEVPLSAILYSIIFNIARIKLIHTNVKVINEK